MGGISVPTVCGGGRDDARCFGGGQTQKREMLNEPQVNVVTSVGH